MFIQNNDLERLAVVTTQNGKALLLTEDKWFYGKWLIARPIIDEDIVVFYYKNKPVAIMPFEELDNVFSATLVYVGHLSENNDIIPEQPIHIFWQ